MKRDDESSGSPLKKHPKLKEEDEDETATAVAVAATEGEGCDNGMRLVYHLNSVVDGDGEFYNAGAVSIVDVVTPDTTECLMTTYEIDTAWLFATLPFLGSGRIPVTLVHGSDESVAVPSGCHAESVHISSPRMPIPYGVNHGKLFLVRLKSGRLRFCVTTANLIEMDWTRKTQGVWMQEFPRKVGSEARSCDFEDTLVDYIERVTGSSSHTSAIREFNFTSANAVLVTSVPGYHNNSTTLYAYGHMKVRKYTHHHHFTLTLTR